MQCPEEQKSKSYVADKNEYLNKVSSYFQIEQWDDIRTMQEIVNLTARFMREWPRSD